MTKPAEIMLGLELPDVDLWSDRVAVALGQNPGPFTGPGTNSYLIGTGSHRILLDPGQGEERYLAVLESALERTGCRGIQEIEGDSGAHLDKYSDPKTEHYAHMIEVISKHLGLTSLGYQRLGDMIEAIGMPREKLCTYCWNGEDLYCRKS